MIRALRGFRSRSALAALTLAALLAVTVSVAAHDGADDAGCAGGFATAAAGPARMLGGHVTLRHADHCVLCHAAQTVRALQAVARYIPPSEALTLVSDGTAASAASIAGAARPARAPPRA